MRSDVAHEIIGYDPATNLIVYREKIPAPYEEKILTMVRPDDDDIDAIDSYVLDFHLANEIVTLARLPNITDSAEFFLESLAVS